MAFEGPRGQQETAPESEQEKAEAALLAELQGAVLESGQPAGPARQLNDTERNLPPFFQPTPEKLKEMEEAGKGCSAALEWTLPDGSWNSRVLDGGIREIVADRIRRIRKETGNREEKADRLNLLAWAVKRHLQLSESDLSDVPDEAAFIIRFREFAKKPEYRLPEESVDEAVDEALDLEIESAELPNVDWGKMLQPIDPAALECTDLLSKTEASPAEGSPQALDRRTGPAADPEAEKRARTEAQNLRLRLGNAVQTGNWEPVSEDYAKRLQKLATHDAHRIMFLDLLRRVESGEMKMPERVLAIGSGPFIEADAEKDFHGKIQALGLTPPRVVNIDAEQAMFEAGKRHVAPGFPKGHRLTLGAVSKAEDLGLSDQLFDLTGNNILHLLKTPEDVFLALSEAVRVTKSDGHIRLYFRRRAPERVFSDGLFSELESQFGLKLLTKPHTNLKLDRRLFDLLAASHGTEKAKRIREHVGNEEYVLAQRTGPDAPALALVRKLTEEAANEARRTAGPDEVEERRLASAKLREKLSGEIRREAYAVTKSQKRTLSTGPAKPEPAPLPAAPIATVEEAAKPDAASEETPGRDPYDSWVSSRDIVKDIRKLERKMTTGNEAGMAHAQKLVVEEIGAALRREHSESGRSAGLEKWKALLLELPIETLVSFMTREQKVELLMKYGPDVAEDLRAEGIL